MIVKLIPPQGTTETLKRLIEIISPVKGKLTTR